MPEIHSTLLTQSARKVLRPLGLLQQGRSRTWLADQIWWLAVVEFQPSSYSKGSYLNVGCMWLWNVKPFTSFDEGHRVQQFRRFESKEQFTTAADQLAEQAAKQVARYRALFPSIRAVSDHYIQNPPVGFWPEYNAAVAHGLSGRGADGAALLEKHIRTMDLSIEWQLKAEVDAKLLLSVIHFPERFEQLIAVRVVQARKLQKLPPVREVDFLRSKFTCP